MELGFGLIPLGGLRSYRRNKRRPCRMSRRRAAFCGESGGDGEKVVNGAAATPTRRRGRPRKTPEAKGKSELSSSSKTAETAAHQTLYDDDEDAVTGKFEVACPEYVTISVPKCKESVLSGDQSVEGEDTDERLYKLEWRTGEENWGVFGDGTYLSQSTYGPNSDTAANQLWPQPGSSIGLDELGLDVLHPGVSLDRAQKAAIRALCERRSVIYSSPEQDSEQAIVRDTAIRSQLWTRHMIYCSASRRKNERMRALIVEAIGEENVGFDVEELRQNLDDASKPPTAMVVSVEVLHEMIFNAENSPLRDTSVVLLDDLIHHEQSHKLWEEMIVAMPTKILIGLLCKSLAERDRKEIPLWFNHVMNAGCKAFRLTRAVRCNAFVFNAGYDTSLRSLDISHEAKEVVSTLSDAILAAELADEEDDRFALERAEEVAREAAEKLLTGRPGPAVTARSSLMLPGGEPEMDSSTVAQIVLRSGHSTPSIRREVLPLLALSHGREETEMTTQAVFSALRGVPLVDAEEEEAIRLAVTPFRKSLEEAGAMTEEITQWFDQVMIGCAALHHGLLPAQNALAEELFRADLLQILAVDTHIGARELMNLASGRTVVVESSAITHHSRAGKGVMHGSVVTSLVGRRGQHDVANLVVVWDDEDLQPFELAAEACAALTSSLVEVSAPGVASDAVSILRTLRRFGGEDWQQLWTLSIGELRRSMDCEPLLEEQETCERDLEAMKSELREVNWIDMAKLTRVEAKLRERSRVLVDMWQHQDTIWAFSMAERLSLAPVGLIIGLKVPDDEIDEHSRLPGGVEEKLIPLSKYFEEGSFKDIALKMEPAKPAVLVKVMRAEGVNSTVAVVTTDGMFRLVSVQDVIALAENLSPIHEASKLEVPLEGEFDEDSESGWLTCKSTNEETSRIAETVGTKLEQHKKSLQRQRPDELEKQIRRFHLAENELLKNPWHGRKEEVENLRAKRRRMVELEKHVEQLKERVDRIMKGAPRRRSLPKRIDSRLRLLEEINCTASESRQITAMGMVTLHLSCQSQFWIMSSMLLTDVPKLEWYEVAAALVAVNSDFNQTLGRLYEGGEYREEFVAGPVISQMLDLRDNIRVVEDKYEIDLSERMLTPLDTRLSRAIKCWAQGDLWQDALVQVDLGGLGPGDLVRVVRRAVSVARQFADGQKHPWVLEDIRRKMELAANGMDRVPIRDDYILQKIDQMVVQGREDTPKMDAVEVWWMAEPKSRKQSHAGNRSKRGNPKSTDETGEEHKEIKNK